MLLCEAAGYDIVLVETVGVGQSETMVAEMVDCFLFLALPGAGDELQGIKRGILELADIVAVNKADGEQLALARSAAADFSAVLRFLRPRSESWQARVLLVSALHAEGIAELWQVVGEHRAALEHSGELQTRRQQQRRHWMWVLIEERLGAMFRSHPHVRAKLAQLEAEVLAGKRTPGSAAEELIGEFGKE
jgi:LAO/AO transport system kinase